jgi:hypothetical protein
MIPNSGRWIAYDQKYFQKKLIADQLGVNVVSA